MIEIIRKNEKGNSETFELPTNKVTVNFISRKIHVHLTNDVATYDMESYLTKEDEQRYMQRISKLTNDFNSLMDSFERTIELLHKYKRMYDEHYGEAGSK